MKKMTAICAALLLVFSLLLHSAAAEGNMNKGTLLVQYCTANDELRKVLIDPAGGMGVFQSSSGEFDTP